MLEIIGLVTGVAILCLMFVGARWCYKRDKRTWNAGICAETGKPWRIVDHDSQGGTLLRSGDVRKWLNGWVKP